VVEPIRLPAPADLARWQRECRSLFGKPNDHLAWAHLDWYNDQGVNRLVVFQMVPLTKASPFMLYLFGEQEPAWRADGTAKGAITTRLGWQLFHTHRAVPMLYWIIQGERGGHKYRFSRREQKALELAGRSGEPPLPGSLPYAPWDTRVVKALKELDRVAFWTKAMDLADRSPDDLDEEMRAAERGMRAQYLDWLERQVDAAADDVSSLTRPLVTDDLVSRDAVPMDADRMRHDYINDV
jgi:hypothetical protein